PGGLRRAIRAAQPLAGERIHIGAHIPASCYAKVRVHERRSGRGAVLRSETCGAGAREVVTVCSPKEVRPARERAAFGKGRAPTQVRENARSFLHDYYDVVGGAVAEEV